MHWGFGKRSLIATTLAGVLIISGCRTTEKDIRRWTHRKQGPDKLVAVLSHNKYKIALRTKAAQALVSMKPRNGQRIGLDRLVQAYAELAPNERHSINQALIPSLVKELGKPPPVPNEKGEVAPDPSVVFKDAAFAIWSNTPPLIDDAELRASVASALANWARVGFTQRLDAAGQKVSMLQMLKELGPGSVTSLPSLINTESAKLGRITQIIAQVGDKSTQDAAAKKLIDVSKQVASKKWLDAKTPLVQAANKSSGLKVSGKRLQAQLERFQEEEIVRSFANLKRIGGSRASAFLIAFASETGRTLKQRLSALAAAQGQLPKGSSKELSALFALAAETKTPPEVRALALRLAGEQPREAIAEPLYAMFGSSDWRVRQAAAELLLLRSESRHLEQFMKHMGQVKDLCVAEPLRYGRLIGELKGDPKIAEVLNSYTHFAQPIGTRLAALGYYYAHGKKEDLATLASLARDVSPLPKCAKNAEQCHWTCSDKEVTRVSEFIKHCVQPFVKERIKLAAAKPTPAKQTNKDKKAAGTPSKASPGGDKSK